MPVDYRILPEHYLVYFRIAGWLDIAEGIRVSDTFLAAPDYRKGMRRLLDLSTMTGWERDFTSIMKEQAQHLDHFDDPQRPTLIVVLARNKEAMSFAHAIRAPWESTGRALVVIVQTEAEALTVLGIDAPNLATVIEGV